MVTNLFSIFDPSTSLNFSMNWLSLVFVYFLVGVLYWLSPSRFFLFFYQMIIYVYNEFKGLILKNSFVLLFSLSIFLFIIFNNFMGLFPYIFTASSHMVFTLSFALPMWLGQMFYGWYNNLTNMLIHLIPQNTPFVLMPFMVVIEMISAFIRPLTLSIRASANMIAGHLLISLLSSAAGNFLLFLPITMVFQLALTGLELAVALIQAYVFSVLITLYSSEMI